MLIKKLWINKLVVDEQFRLADNMHFSAINGSLKLISVWNSLHTHVWVQLLEFGKACLASGYLTDMSFFTVEVSSEIVECNNLRIIN